MSSSQALIKYFISKYDCGVGVGLGMRKQKVAMTKVSDSLKVLPALMADQLQKLGKDIKIARKHPQLQMKSMEDACWLVYRPLQRPEKDGSNRLKKGPVALVYFFQTFEFCGI